MRSTEHSGFVVNGCLTLSIFQCMKYFPNDLVRNPLAQSNASYPRSVSRIPGIIFEKLIAVSAGYFDNRLRSAFVICSLARARLFIPGGLFVRAVSFPCIASQMHNFELVYMQLIRQIDQTIWGSAKELIVDTDDAGSRTDHRAHGGHRSQRYP
jgi:hypothetical protein